MIKTLYAPSDEDLNLLYKDGWKVVSSYVIPELGYREHSSEFEIIAYHLYIIIHKENNLT